MKKILIFISTLILLLLIVLGINLFKKDNKIEYKEEVSINIGEEIPDTSKFVDSKYKVSKIKWENIDLKKAGKYSGVFEYKNTEYTVYLNIIDSEKPVISGVKDITIFVNDNVDLLQNVKVTDNSNDEISIGIEGEYDIKKVGIYNLKYTAKDSSNNETKEEFKLTVKEKPVISKPSNNIVKDGIIGKTSKGYTIEIRNGIYYVNGILIANKSYSLPSSYHPGGLVSDFTTNFNKMASDALNSGVNLRIISGFRSYNTQVNLYNNYVNRDGKQAADTYSARAGHSEHQTGLAADINSLEQSFINTKEGKWLNDNCSKYGFIIRYPKGKENKTGYMYEPWHIRYVGVDIASRLYNNGNWITLEEYLGISSEY